jgi:hypothetical protein
LRWVALTRKTKPPITINPEEYPSLKKLQWTSGAISLLSNTIRILGTSFDVAILTPKLSIIGAANLGLGLGFGLCAFFCIPIGIALVQIILNGYSRPAGKLFCTEEAMKGYSVMEILKCYEAEKAALCAAPHTHANDGEVCPAVPPMLLHPMACCMDVACCIKSAAFCDVSCPC